MGKTICAILVSLFFWSCAATLPYATDYPLTGEHFHSNDGVLTGAIPKGWFFSTDDSVDASLTAWLIRQDFSAVLLIRELSLDRETVREVEREGITFLATTSAGLHLDAAGESRIEPQEFELHQLRFCGYEVPAHAGRVRVVVFSVRGRYYECEARPVKGKWTDDDLKRMFAAQQSLLSSLVF